MRNQDLAAAMAGLAAALDGKPAQVHGGVSPPDDVIEAADRIVREFDLKGIRYWIQGDAVRFTRRTLESERNSRSAHSGH